MIKKLKEMFREHRHMRFPICAVIIVPILISILYGSQFSNFPYHDIPIVIVNHDKGKTARDLSDMISQQETFNVVKYSDSETEMENMIRDNKAYAGIVIPEGFSNAILNGKEAKVLVLNDGGVSPASSDIRGKVCSVLGTVQSGFMMGIAEGKLGMTPQQAMNFISPFRYEISMIGNPTSNIAYMFVEGLILTALQIGAMAVGCFIKERKNLKLLFGKAVICSLVVTISSIVSLTLMTGHYQFPYNGSVLAGVILSFLCYLGFVLFGIFNCMSSNNQVESAVEKTSIIGFTMTLCGYTYPLIAMPWFFQKLAWFLPAYHYILPLRNLALTEKALANVNGDIMWLIGFVLLMSLLVLRKFFKQKQPDSKEAVESCA